MKNFSLFIKLCFIPYWDEMDDAFMKWAVHEAALGRPEQLATVASAGYGPLSCMYCVNRRTTSSQYAIINLLNVTPQLISGTHVTDTYVVALPTA